MDVPIWSILPFVLLLLLIAVGPLWFHHWWEHHYPKVSISLGLLVGGYLVATQEKGLSRVIESMIEYASFIALIGSLFIVSGGVLIKIVGKPTALGNTAILAVGGAIANIVGTTGAAMLLIRPFLRFNQSRMKPYLPVFFIFIVCNIGGALTPIGDPPLFLGYLYGVPFFWTVENLTAIWLPVMAVMLGMFYVLDRRNTGEEADVETRRIELDIRGLPQVFFLIAILSLVLVQKAEFLHRFPHHIVSLVIAALMFGVAFASLRVADPEVLKENEFNFHPLKEVAFLFVGIFLTMIPALEYLNVHAKEFGIEAPWKFFFITGGLSAGLDNAPTYLTFLSVALGMEGFTIGDQTAVRQFLELPIGPPLLEAISLAAVFWGAMTYIGNGPNFMVKNISQSMGANPPDFMTYFFRYACVYLLPVLILVGIFFALR